MSKSPKSSTRNKPNTQGDDNDNDPTAPYEDTSMLISRPDMGKIPLDYIDTEDPNNIFIRQTDPFNAKRVEAILKAVLIGTDLSNEQCKEVRNTIQEYADCFALSVSEVTLVLGAIHKLNIPEGATFSRKKIDELLATGVIEACNPSQVKCITPIMLVKKVHEGEGLALEELQHRVNDQCILAGYEQIFDLPPRPESTDIPTQQPANRSGAYAKISEK
ncbi:hypothetical protein A0H81_04920 [Grifola frondosa]|uniref:Uncharacterized protein n=1 Tax=Grifola frondosa TaxID=5627 RepID=A0A1C7MGI2_GRIFR|nr:hypothetical protein A0H81_04920 [Grifola frondosa]